jgi:hypothetical protein
LGYFCTTNVPKLFVKNCMKSIRARGFKITNTKNSLLDIFEMKRLGVDSDGLRVQSLPLTIERIIGYLPHLYNRELVLVTYIMRKSGFLEL